MNSQKINLINNCYMKKNEADGISFPVCDRVANSNNGTVLDLLLHKSLIGNQPITNNLVIPGTSNINRLNLFGLQKPAIQLEEHQDYVAFRETVNRDEKKNIGVIFPNYRDMKKFVLTNEVDKEIKKVKHDTVYGSTGIDLTKTIKGGAINYYEKYMKYKQKYLRLKAENIFV